MCKAELGIFGVHIETRMDTPWFWGHWVGAQVCGTIKWAHLLGLNYDTYVPIILNLEIESL